MKLGQNVCLDEIWSSWKMGHVRSKSRSLGQMLEKPYVCSRGNIFSPIIMKLYQHFCLDEIPNEFENESCRVENYVSGSNVRKSSCTL